MLQSAAKGCCIPRLERKMQLEASSLRFANPVATVPSDQRRMWSATGVRLCLRNDVDRSLLAACGCGTGRARRLRVYWRINGGPKRRAE